MVYKTKERRLMLAYHLEVQDETILDKLKAFVQTLPANAVMLTPEKDDFKTELEILLNREIEAPSIAKHQEVISQIKTKYAF